jgi:hypothetical protein
MHHSWRHRLVKTSSEPLDRLPNRRRAGGSVEFEPDAWGYQPHKTDLVELAAVPLASLWVDIIHDLALAHT